MIMTGLNFFTLIIESLIANLMSTNSMGDNPTTNNSADVKPVESREEALQYHEKTRVDGLRRWVATRFLAAVAISFVLMMVLMWVSACRIDGAYIDRDGNRWNVRTQGIYLHGWTGDGDERGDGNGERDGRDSSRGSHVYGGWFGRMHLGGIGIRLRANGIEFENNERWRRVC
jgi:uncharacterized membrane protein YgcG